MVDDVPFEQPLFAVVARADGPFAIGDGGTLLADCGEARQAGESADGDQFEGRGEYHDGEEGPSSTNRNAERSGDGDGTEPSNESVGD